jgi:SMODS and SLOG-associating 2TM effector domain 1/Protein of unknown function (DUF4231)
MTANLEHAWSEQSIWSQVADRLKKSLQKRRRVAAILAITGAVSAAVAAGLGLSTGAGKVFAFLSAATLGVGTIVQAMIGPDAVRDWTRARSVAEAIKSEVFLTLAGFGAADFEAEMQRIAVDGADLTEHRAGLRPEKRHLPPVQDTGTYFTERVTQQIDEYYQKRVDQLTITLSRYRAAEIALGVIGVLLGAAAGTWELDTMAMWVPVVTTVAAAVVAHAAAERYSFQLVEYTRTAAELGRILAKAGAAATLSDEQRVRRAEEVISIQNEGWMIKVGSPAP